MCLCINFIAAQNLCLHFFILAEGAEVNALRASLVSSSASFVAQISFGQFCWVATSSNICKINNPLYHHQSSISAMLVSGALACYQLHELPHHVVSPASPSILTTSLLVPPSTDAAHAASPASSSTAAP